MRTDCINRNPGRYTWWDYRGGNFHKDFGSDHAPLVIDIDSPGCPFDAGWASADSRIAARLRKQ